MDYAFLVETYASERLKTLNVWAMFQERIADINALRRVGRPRGAPGPVT